MKIFVFKGKKVFFLMLMFFMLAATVFVVLMSKYDAIAIFSTGRNLPIYSVDYPEKKIAITFDCA